jgi:predicted alternative tryptophan synthase beta-subunit
MGTRTKYKSSQRQTRLTFTPLPASSPYSSHDPSSIEDRKAAITVDILPSSLNKTKVIDNALREDAGEHFNRYTHILRPAPLFFFRVQKSNEYLVNNDSAFSHIEEASSSKIVHHFVKLAADKS